MFILNGEEKAKKKKFGSSEPVEEGATEWDYIYKIEFWLKAKFNHGDYCFTWAVFDCCRSILKERETLSTRELEDLEKKKKLEDDDEEEVKEDNGKATRGEGGRLLGFNYLFINGCQANMVVDDENSLVQNIGEELRLHQKNKEVTFPGCVANLSKRFPAAAVTSTTTIDPTLEFDDEYFRKLKINPDQIHPEIEDGEAADKKEKK